MSRGKSGGALLRMLLSFSVLIVVANCLIGIAAPISAGLDDEIVFFDTLWRVVAGQRVGIDYHFPLALGAFQVGALLWNGSDRITL